MKNFLVTMQHEVLNRFLKRLVENGYKKYKCENAECGVVDWHSKEIKLQPHHINGKHDDNRLENLQILCSNCHSQTENYDRHNYIKSFKITERVNEILQEKPKTCGHIDIDTVANTWFKKEKTIV